MINDFDSTELVIILKALTNTYTEIGKTPITSDNYTKAVHDLNTIKRIILRILETTTPIEK